MTEIDVSIDKSSSRRDGKTSSTGLVQSDNHRVKRMISATWLVSPGFYYKTAISAEPASDRCGSTYFVTCRNRGVARERGLQLQLATGLKDEDGHAHWEREDSCGHIECRTCGGKEVKREASVIMRRFRALRRALRAQGFIVGSEDDIAPIEDGLYWDHATLSPPASEHHKFETMAGYRAMRAKAERYAQRVGYMAYYIVFHLVHEGEGEGKKLTTRQRKQRLEAWQRGELELELWPHFHIYGLRPTWGTTPTAKLYEKSGWVFRSFYSKEHRFRNVYKTLLYELGHASAPVNDGRSGQIASPVGWLHPSYLHCDEEKLKEPVKCPLCGDECIKANHDGQPMIGYDGQPIVQTRVTVKRTYYIRDEKAYRIEAKEVMRRVHRRYGTIDGYIDWSDYGRWNLPDLSFVPVQREANRTMYVRRTPGDRAGAMDWSNYGRYNVPGASS